MGYFKRFGDFCAAFGAFSAVMYLFCQYMAMDFKEIESLREKLEFFFSNSPKKDHRFYLPLILFFILSFTVSTCLHKYPQFTLALSVLPMIQTVAMFDAGRLYERPMLYFVLSALHICGCLFECIRRDREDRGRRAAISADLLGLCFVGFCIYIILTAKGIADIDRQKADIFETLLWNGFGDEPPDMKLFKYTVIFYCALTALRLMWRDLYYLDAILSVIPLVSAVYLLNTEKIPIFGTLLVTLTFIYAITRISIMLFCKPRLKK